jgi:hypothetical protein
VTIREQLIDAFGTVWNIYRQLGLGSSDVSFPTFSRSYRGEAISAEHLATIVAAWEFRRQRPVSA